MAKINASNLKVLFFLSHMINFLDDSLKSHEDCYDQCQFAKLPFKDVLKFIHIIDSDDFWEGPVFKLAGSWIYQTFSDFLSLEWLILLFSN